MSYGLTPDAVWTHRDLTTPRGGRACCLSGLGTQSDAISGLQRGRLQLRVQGLELGEVDAGVAGDRAEGLAVSHGPEPWSRELGARGWRVGPQVQALPRLEAVRVGVGIERLELRDCQPGLCGDLRVRVAGVDRPVGRYPADGALKPSST